MENDGRIESEERSWKEESGTEGGMFSVIFRCNSLQLTTQLAQSLAKSSSVGELFLLSGSFLSFCSSLVCSDLGAGKTSFARGYIRALTEDPNLVVNSPSYLLDNTYELIDGTT